MGYIHTEMIGEQPVDFVFLHGLLGRGRNWTSIAKALAAPRLPATAVVMGATAATGADLGVDAACIGADRGLGGRDVVAGTDLSVDTDQTGESRGLSGHDVVMSANLGATATTGTNLGTGANLSTETATVTGFGSLLVDIPNHGSSAWTPRFDYLELADQIAEVLSQYEKAPILVGHSMGGKIAMALALRHPGLIRGLAVLDIAPGQSDNVWRLEPIIAAALAIDLTQVKTRREVEDRLRKSVPDAGVRALLLQNLRATNAPANRGKASALEAFTAGNSDIFTTRGASAAPKSLDSFELRLGNDISATKRASATPESLDSEQRSGSDTAAITASRKASAISEAMPSWKWQPNLPMLYDQLAAIAGWPQFSEQSWNGSVLWLRGAKSSYVTTAHEPQMWQLFPNLRSHVIPDCGHWLHVDQPALVIAELRNFALSL